METTTASATETTQPKGKAGRIVTHVVRVLMGVAFFFFGLSYFLKLMQPKGPMPENIVAVNTALVNAGYMNVAMGTMLLAGTLLLINRFVPLALALIAPILVGILTFHISLAPATIMPGVVLSLLELYMAWAYRSAFRPMLRAKVQPG